MQGKHTQNKKTIFLKKWIFQSVIIKQLESVQSEEGWNYFFNTLYLRVGARCVAHPGDCSTWEAEARGFKIRDCLHEEVT